MIMIFNFFQIIGDQRSDILEKKCTECESLFICEEDAVTCWCASLPKLSKDEIDDGDCVCKKCLLKKYRKKLLKTDEIKKDLFEEKYRYQWRNRHQQIKYCL